MLTPSPRLCVLKREEGESYGFHVQVEQGSQGHIIRNVELGGVAGRSGLQDGDRLLEVNNCYIVNALRCEVNWASDIIKRKNTCLKDLREWVCRVSLFVNKVARKISLSGHQVCLLVLNGEEYEQALSRGQDLRDLARSYKGEGCNPPRLCHITRNPASGLGINFTPVEGNCKKSKVQNELSKRP